MKLFESVKKSLIKRAVKGKVNEKLNLEGKYDKDIDRISEKVIDKVGVENILKAKRVVDDLSSLTDKLSSGKAEKSKQ
ncbi:hypothetical protein [Microbulbifer marinus]|uniref:Transposase, putative, N-terminal domain-containing protein n=1 Tax=Microbulbifer marinus TaxID=658218 RepID=A0A1H3WFZ3_9GAMM|nr:hypothetical protein [Microbulbifer marinus]SDZ86023.1 transposase, putative, N-terminal domain-containing protein [Microbulbifer marinus]